MELSEIRAIYNRFDVESPFDSYGVYGEGNINRTFWVENKAGEMYILQKINTNVFKNPVALMENMVGITEFLKKKIGERGGDVERETLNLVHAKDGKTYCEGAKGGFWRMTHFVKDTVAYQSVEKDGLLYEVARSFGNFQMLLSDYPAETLFDTIPDFHNTAKRYQAFKLALADNIAHRAESVEREIAALEKYADRASVIVDKLASGELPTRVTHNDTKLNNILMDKNTDKGVCVIDLDTVMSGSLLYDFGDSVRFAANNGAEDDKDLSRVWIRTELYEEYVSGFLAGVGDSITNEEIKLLPMSVFILTYELALRFMTDYLNGDTYFKLNYPEHNLIRTRAQIRLMEDINAKMDILTQITEKYIK